MKKSELENNGGAHLSVKVSPSHKLNNFQDVKTKLSWLISQRSPVSDTDNEAPISLGQGNTEVMQFLAELNEGAVQLIKAESFKEALNALSQAEKKISTLDNILLTEEPYVITVFYNIACCHQKLGNLDQWNTYLKWAIQLFK